MNIKYYSLNTSQDLKPQILSALQQDKVKSFGCDRKVDTALRTLKNQGKIRYVRVKDGGNGWELIK